MGNLDLTQAVDQEKKVERQPRFQQVVAVITHSAVVPVGTLGDEDLQLVFEIIKGPSKGLKVAQYIPLRSGNESLRVRGCVVLRALCNALGTERPSDSKALHGRPLVLQLSRRRGSEDKPHAQYLPCTPSTRKAWQQRAEREASQTDEKAPEQKSQVGE